MPNMGGIEATQNILAIEKEYNLSHTPIIALTANALKGDREGQHSISINEQWRICFRFIDGDAYDVEITDYH